jgi:hypothetical protein
MKKTAKPKEDWALKLAAKRLKEEEKVRMQSYIDRETLKRKLRF